jgi:serine/threonine-protein kinase RsbW
MPKELTKTISSKTDSLLSVRHFVSEAAKAFGFTDEDSSKIVLAVDEACTNIIKHAYQNAPNQQITITIVQEKDRFEVRISDEGRSFDPKTLRPLNLKEHLTKYRRGGLGVYLMKSLMDEVEYRSIGGKTNEVRLTKYLS